MHTTTTISNNSILRHPQLDLMSTTVFASSALLNTGIASACASHTDHASISIGIDLSDELGSVLLVRLEDRLDFWRRERKKKKKKKDTATKERFQLEDVERTPGKRTPSKQWLRLKHAVTTDHPS
jgi:hypothetical protein